MISYNVLQKSLISLKSKKYSPAKYALLFLHVSIRSVSIRFDFGVIILAPIPPYCISTFIHHVTELPTKKFDFKVDRTEFKQTFYTQF